MMHIPMIDWRPFFHNRALLDSRIWPIGNFPAAGKMRSFRFSA